MATHQHIKGMFLRYCVKIEFTFCISNPAFVLYNGHDFGSAIDVGKMLPCPLVVQARAAVNNRNAPWVQEETNTILIPVIICELCNNQNRITECQISKLKNYLKNTNYEI